MTFSDEVLMAYADEELDEKTRLAVESAMATDPEIARRVAQHRALRKHLHSVFDPVLNEPVPAHLIDLARNSHVSSTPRKSAKVIPLRRRAAPGRSVPRWAALAASLLIGILAGRLAFRTGDSEFIAIRNGQMMASGLLADALTSQLASQQRAAQRVQIGVSFRSKSGQYCRTFSTHTPRLAGLACHEMEGWQLQVLSGTHEPQTTAGGYRQAASSMPAAVATAISNEISGEPLDARAEAAARSRNWRP